MLARQNLSSLQYQVP